MEEKENMDVSVKPSDRADVTNYRLENLFIMFFIFAFTGWVWEVIYIGFTEGVIAKRGMLHGPWLPIYGCGGVLILLLLGRFKAHPAAVFGMAVLLCGTMEYSTALMVEAIFHSRWWDYSTKFMNINGRVCLGGLLLFGISGTVAVCKVGPILDARISKLRREPHMMLIMALGAAFVLDLVLSMFMPNMGAGITYDLLN